MARKLVAIVGIALLAGCGAGQVEPETPESPESDPMFEDLESEQRQDAAPEPAPARTGPVSEFGDDRPEPIPQPWQLREHDCNELREKYEELLLAVEMEKLNKRNLKPKFRPSAERNVRNTAKSGADTWLRACQEVIGTVQHKQRWDCAYEASTYERFKGCLDGKYDDEAK